ncbi:MAG: hypothetical protein K6T78_16080 [Alicyclobacillus sp.]|nr:hypothetical protein [Alicyclobacillus sp.]
MEERSSNERTRSFLTASGNEEITVTAPSKDKQLAAVHLDRVFGLS